MILKRIKKYLYYYFASPERYAKYVGAKIGKGVYISTKKFPTESYLIEIGDYVRVAAGTSFYTHGGIWSIRKKYHDNAIDTFGKISVGNYSYIGENCMIMPGVKIGENCIIGGGSVLTRSVPDGVMVAGNPAKFIGYTDKFYERVKQKKEFCCKNLNHKEKEIYLKSLSEDVFKYKKNISIPE